MSKRNALVLVSLLALVPLMAPKAGFAANETAARLHNDSKNLIKAGKYQDALETEKKALGLDSMNPAYHRALSVIYAHLESYQAAYEEAQAAIKLAPDDPIGHYNLGTLLESRQKYGDALGEYEKAISLGKNDLNTRRGLYQCMAQSGRTGEAVDGLEKLSGEAPRSKEVWLALASAYLLYSDTEGAREAALKAVSIDPNWYPAAQCQVLVAIETSRLADARALARKLIKINPGNPYGYSLLSKLSCEDYNFPEPAEWLATEAIANQAQSASLLVQLGRDFVSAALASGLTRAGRSPSPGSTWLSLAERVLRQAWRASPGSCQANFELARVLVLERRPSDALPYAKKAYELSPSNEGSRLLYQQCNAVTNDLAGALKRWLRKSSN